jgi:hypothetical protein
VAIGGGRGRTGLNLNAPLGAMAKRATRSTRMGGRPGRSAERCISATKRFMARGRYLMTGMLRSTHVSQRSYTTGASSGLRWTTLAAGVVMVAGAAAAAPQVRVSDIVVLPSVLGTSLASFMGHAPEVLKLWRFR